MVIQNGLMSSRMEADRWGDPKVRAPKCPVERLNVSHTLTNSAPGLIANQREVLP